MTVVHKNQFSTYNVQLGSGNPQKKIQVTNEYQNDADEVEGPRLYPAGVNVHSDRTTFQDNIGGVEALYPLGVNVGMDDQIRPKLGEACRVQFPGCGELKEVIDSENFSYTVTDPDGRKNLFEAKYKILNSGVLDVLWHSARLITEDVDGLTGGVAPMLPIL